MLHSTEAKRLAQWQQMRDYHQHTTKKEAARYWEEAANRQNVAQGLIAKFEEEIAIGEKLTCEDINIAPERADELEAYRAAHLRYARSFLSEQREAYERARKTAAFYEAAFRFEETSDLVKWYGSIFKEEPKPKKRATATRKRKTSRK